MIPEEKFVKQMRKDESEWCLALHGNHDEHQCHKKPGHATEESAKTLEAYDSVHECYCGVWW